jgi:predicted nucleic acid-binding protein
MSQAMSNVLVLDASMALAWLLERPEAQEQKLAIDCLRHVSLSETVVPQLWHLEVANVLCQFERRRLLTTAASDEFSALLAKLPISTDSETPALRRDDIRLLARQYALSAYDATYLDIVLRRNATLATFDRRLADACRAAGGRVFGDHEPAIHETIPDFRS